MRSSNGNYKTVVGGMFNLDMKSNFSISNISPANTVNPSMLTRTNRAQHTINQIKDPKQRIKFNLRQLSKDIEDNVLEYRKGPINL